MTKNPLNRSFILFKPDALHEKKINEYIFNQITSRGLIIVDKLDVVLTDEQIEYLWQYTITDTVCKTLVSRYLEKKSLLLIIVESTSDCIKITSEIKKEVRERFSKSPFQNCIHAPATISELKKDLSILLEVDFNPLNFENPTIVSSFDRLDNFSEEQYIKCALVLEKGLTSFSFEQWQPVFQDLSENFKLILIDDDLHDAKYTAGVILECFPDYTLEEAYYIAFGVNYIGNFPLFATNNEKRKEEVVNFFAEHDMLVKEKK